MVVMSTKSVWQATTSEHSTILRLKHGGKRICTEILNIIFYFSVENQSIENKPAIVSPPRQVLPGYVTQQPPPHNNQIHLQTDFTSPPPTHPHGFWPQQAFPNSWQTQFRMPSPAPQTKTTVTNTTTCNNNAPTFSSSSNSTIRSPLPRWRAFNNAARQRTPYQYGSTPRNNYPRQFSQNAVCYWGFYYNMYIILHLLLPTYSFSEWKFLC